ncbi:MAG: hypothetical protein ACRDAU_05280 [Clostridium sp.]
MKKNEIINKIKVKTIGWESRSVEERIRAYKLIGTEYIKSLKNDDVETLDGINEIVIDIVGEGREVLGRMIGGVYVDFKYDIPSLCKEYVYGISPDVRDNWNNPRCGYEHYNYIIHSMMVCMLLEMAIHYTSEEILEEEKNEVIKDTNIIINIIKEFNEEEELLNII